MVTACLNLKILFRKTHLLEITYITAGLWRLTHRINKKKKKEEKEEKGGKEIYFNLRIIPKSMSSPFSFGSGGFRTHYPKI